MTGCRAGFTGRGRQTPRQSCLRVYARWIPSASAQRGNGPSGPVAVSWQWLSPKCTPSEAFRCCMEVGGFMDPQHPLPPTWKNSIRAPSSMFRRAAMSLASTPWISARLSAAPSWRRASRTGRLSNFHRGTTRTGDRPATVLQHRPRRRDTVFVSTQQDQVNCPCIWLRSRPIQPRAGRHRPPGRRRDQRRQHSGSKSHACAGMQEDKQGRQEPGHLAPTGPAGVPRSPQRSSPT